MSTTDLIDPKVSRTRVRAINKAIRAEEKRLRAKHGWLRHQDALGLGIWLGSFALWGLVCVAWLTGALPWWAAIPLATLPLSWIHELEHDLIHDLYFKQRPWVQDVMFVGIFLAKATLDPWTRRRIHIRHHKVSGQPVDIEERLIGLGLPMGPKRILLTIVPAFAALVLPDVIAALKAQRAEAGPRSRARGKQGPLRIAAHVLSTFFGLMPFVVVPAAILGQGWAIVVLVLYLGPNTLRHATIALISSSSHYYGDIPGNDVHYQNQILDHWLTWPLQIFCFNFGSTHIIHHYVVLQPFYLRQMVSPGVRQALLDNGVRRNDLGTVARANRWIKTAEA